jgi:putative phosphoribosyl transferase
VHRIRFKDREEAGEKLVHRLKQYKQKTGVVVLGLARGGVITASAIARALQVPLDVIVVRKIGAPGNAELAIGAITAHGAQAFNMVLIKQVEIPQSYIDDSVAREKAECAQREHLYRVHKSVMDLTDKTVILVDDGIATGLTMEAAIKDVRKRGSKTVVVAAPVMPADVVDQIKPLCDELFFLIAPEDFLAIGAFYVDFTQVTHDKVIAALKAQN